MANLPRHENLPGPLDTDTDLSKFANNRLRDGKNVELYTDSALGDLRPLRGTVARAVLPGGSVNLYNVCATVSSWGMVGGVKKRGIVYFVASGTENFIWFYDIDSDQFHSLNEEYQNWTGNTMIDAVAISDNETTHFVYYVDGINEIRRIRIDNTLTQTIDDLFVQPLFPIDGLYFSQVATGGALLSGAYQFLYRYYNKDKCVYSAWSNITPAIPVIPDGDGTCTPNKHGGRIGQPTNKKIVLNIPTSIGVRNFDSIQLLAIENTSGAKTLPTAGKLLYPIDIGNSIEYSGNESGITTDLADVLTDKLNILKPKTLDSDEDRLWVGDFELEEYQGSPTITGAHTIEQVVDYSCEDDCVNYRSAFRDETYIYGIRYIDFLGGSVIYPFDLSSYGPTTLKQSAVATVTSIAGVSGDETTLNISATTAFVVGDLIKVGTTQATVIDILTTTQMIVKGGVIFPGGADIDLLQGQAGNHSTSFSWRFPKRNHSKFTIFNESGQLTALGLHIQGLKDHPTWAKAFEIVRLKRKKDILYQCPHVPGIVVQGRWTSNVEDPQGSNVYVKDYSGQWDCFVPKIHMMGGPRNLWHFIQEPEEPASFNAVLWTSQETIHDSHEITPMIFGQSPEYLYNIDGESFDLQIAHGALVSIVDAVQLIYSDKHQENLSIAFNKIGGGGTDQISQLKQKASIFSARTRERYFYSREHYYLDNGTKIYQTLIPDLPAFQNSISQDNLKIKYQLAQAYGAPLTALPHSSMNSQDFQSIPYWGSLNDLIKNQSQHPSVSSNVADLFRPDYKNQRGLIWETEDRLEDFTRILCEGKLFDNIDYFPLIPWTTQTPVLTNELLEEQIEAPSPTYVLTVPSVSEGEVACGAYILNIRRNLGDDRYGDIDNLEGQWVSTGAYQALTEDDITNNTPFNLDVFGGDCFITRHAIKVADATPQPVIYDPIESELGPTPVNHQRVVKTGKAMYNAEILDVYLESEINGNYSVIEGRYPESEDNKLGLYTPEFDYYYHPGYSKENIDKALVTFKQFCVDNTKLAYTYAWSDSRVRGGTSNPFNDIDGFNAFRVNNIRTLQGEKGSITKIVALGDKALHIFQEYGIAFQPIGVDELRTQDGQVIATGTGAVIGSGDFYLQRNIGSQHLHSIQKWDGIIYGVDAHRKVIYAFGSRGAGFKTISIEKMVNALTRQYLEVVPQAHELRAFIDERNERFIIHNTGGKELRMLAYSIKAQAWEPSFELPSGFPVLNGHSEDDRVFWFTRSLTLHEAYRGDNLSLFGNTIEGLFTMIVNNYDNVPKVFSSVHVNARNRIDAIKCLVYDEDAQLPHQETEWLTLDKDPRNHQYHVNTLRAKENGKSKKLRGQRMEMRFRLKGDNETIVSAIITHSRKSF